MELNQYQIVLVNLDPTVGSEVNKTRPCVILSPNEMNKFLRTIIIAPVTSSSKNYPTRVAINAYATQGWVMIDQIRTIDRNRIAKIFGTLSEKEISKIKNVLKETLVD